MRELRPGIWHWTSPHPDWDSEQWWPQVVSSYGSQLGDDLVLWIPAVNAIVSSDTLSDFGDGLGIQMGGRKHLTPEQVPERLRPLLDLPVELVLPAHGEPTDRAALERALGTSN